MTDNMETIPTLLAEPSYEAFRRTWPALSRALGASDAIREQVWASIAAGTVRVFSGGGATVMARIMTETPEHSRRVYAQVANGTSDALNALLDDVADWARSNGCTAISMDVEPDEASVYDGFLPTVVTLRRGLT